MKQQGTLVIVLLPWQMAGRNRYSWNNHGEMWVTKHAVAGKGLCESYSIRKVCWALTAQRGTSSPGLGLSLVASGRHIRSAGAVGLGQTC